ncbi:unnamed protein product, partial [Sphagnum tenellum]
MQYVHILACSTPLLSMLYYHNRILEGLGSMSPLAAVSRDVFHGSSPVAAYSCTVCVILAGRKQLIRCWDSRDPRRIFSVGKAGVSYVGVAGGDGFMCGLRESTGQPFCWNLRDEKNSSSSWRRSQQQHRLSQKRYVQIAVGESHVCALRRVNGSIHCWRLKGWDQQHPRRSSSTSTSPHGFAFLSLTAGGDFTCGLTNGSQMMCWGVELNLNVSTMYSSISAGRRHVCGIRVADGAVECFGNYPLQTGGAVSPAENWAFSSLALGASHSCGLRTETHEAVCWGDNSTAQLAAPQGVAFASITASDFYTCGIKETDLSTVCWGRGFDNSSPKKNRSEFLFPPQLKAAPGICTNSPCPVGSFSFHGSNATMGVGGNVCANRNQFVCLACSNSTCQGPPAAAMTPLSNSSLRRTMLATISLGVLGGVGILVSLVALICCCFLNRKQQQQIPKLQNCCTGKFACNANARRRSSSNNSHLTNRADLFTFNMLAAATEGFGDGRRIGAGSFGVVYRGVLPDGREVAIKRAEKMNANKTMYEDNETAFEKELEFLSRVHHRNLVKLVGYCDDDDELLLVLEYMPNGTLYDHLHDDRHSNSGAISSWHLRVKIALEAARGIEYLHTYAVPAVIHRDIKSSNILLDASWTACVSDFGLSLLGPEEEVSHISMAAAGTMGYIDPEYYRLQHLTTKSDVYSFGVVLLELLTGRKAISKCSNKNNKNIPANPVINVVDFATPRIQADELVSILDFRLPIPQGLELQAVSILASVAAHCVRQEGKERPSMTHIVTCLEQAFSFSCNNRRKLQPALQESS